MAHDDIPIQVVDADDRPAGGASMQRVWQEGLIHRISRVMVEDQNGRILLQKRQIDKELYPGCWDPSAAGHVDEGETYEQAAARETEEEIGLSGFPLTEVGYYKSHGTFRGMKLNRFNKFYKIVVPPDTAFDFDKEEVAGVQWFTLAEAKKLAAEQPDNVSDGLAEILKQYY